MNLKRLVLVLVGVLALSAVLSSSADGAVNKEEVKIGETTTKVQTTQNTWKNSSGVAWSVNTPKEVKCSKKSTAVILSGTILGTSTELSATGLSCTSATLENKAEAGESGEAKMAIGSAVLKLTGVTVVKPAGCGVSSSMIETAPIKLRVWHHFVNGTTTNRPWVRFEPTTEGGNFFSLKITGCAIAGTYPFRGAFYGISPNNTGEAKVNQVLEFNAESNSFGALKFGGNTASLTGETNQEVVSAEAFQTSE